LVPFGSVSDVELSRIVDASESQLRKVRIKLGIPRNMSSCSVCGQEIQNSCGIVPACRLCSGYISWAKHVLKNNGIDPYKNKQLVKTYAMSSFLSCLTEEKLLRRKERQNGNNERNSNKT
jgi:hypothetical protein